MQLRRKQEAEEQYRNRRSSEINLGFNQWLLVHNIVVLTNDSGDIPDKQYSSSDYSSSNSSSYSSSSYDYSSSSCD